ncbi:signal peptidase I [Pneumocystis jirovecii RU7]|uniref:Signal peptidase complex catalytic subunit SEC11 n=1 Tax=Pneumocystis jirovecii (strain RU7) TaxID=1408657 RepID=A0A0W4ZU01_PNEJ7|nr:signal peptidase I [Pneumocystis jirovecii RU7]KTW31853.1 signal peptidase I [Pneumocystis jirovecii RU7]
MLFQLKYSGLRQTLLQILNLCLVCSTAYMIWKGLSVVTNCESPIVVVLSGSMEPAFQRGDILFLDNRQQRVNIGDIVVYRVKEHDIPIVHRVIQERHGHESQKVLTKGDNNRYDDLELYSKNQVYLDRENIIGVVKGFVPYVGWITLAMNDFPKLKYCFLGGMGLITLIHRE